MRAHKKFFPFLYFFLASLIPLIIFIFAADPNFKVNFVGINIPMSYPFFILFFASVFFLFTFVFANRRRGVLAACFFDGILILRSMGFRSAYQVVLLLLIILLLEYLYSRPPGVSHKPNTKKLEK